MAAFPNPILEQAKAATAKANSVLSTASDQQDSIAKKTDAASTTLTNAAKEKARSISIIENQKATAELQAQNARIKAFNAAGGGDYLTGLMKELKSTTNEVLKAQQVVEDIQSKPVNGILDLVSQSLDLLGPGDKLQAAKQRQATITQSIANITGAQESITRAVATTKETFNNATIAASSNAIAAEGQAAAAKAELDGLSMNSQAVARGAAATVSQMNSMIETYKLGLTEENQAIRRKNQEFTEKAQTQKIKQWEDGAALRSKELERVDLQLKDLKDPTRIAAVTAQREEIVKKHADNLAFEANYVAGVQRAQASLGQSVETPEVIRTLRLSDVKSKDKYDRLYKMGNKDSVEFGTTPAAASANLSVTGASKTPPVMLLETLKRGFQDEISKSMDKKALSKPGAMQDTAFNSYVANVVKSWESNIKAGDATNPYQAPPMEVLAHYPNVTDTKLYKDILAPMDMKELEPKRIYDAAITGIEAGTIKLEEAAMDIESLFKAVAIHNSNSKMFSRIGLPNQTSYKTEIVPPELFSERSLGAAGGAGLGLGALAAAGYVASAPVSIPASIAVVGGSAFLGSQTKGIFAPDFPVTDSLDRTQITQALIKLQTDKHSLGSFFK